MNEAQKAKMLRQWLTGKAQYTPVIKEIVGEMLDTMIYQREAIARFVYEAPPFDECAGIDLHERAGEFAEEHGLGGDLMPHAYYEAFLDCALAAVGEQ